MNKAHFIKTVLLLSLLWLNVSSATNIYSWNYFNSPLPRLNIWSFPVDSSGLMWIPNYNGGIFRTDTYSWQLIDTSNSDIPSNYINNILVDNKNNKWMGSIGLIKYNDKEWQLFNETNSTIPAGKVTPLYFDRNNNIWLTYKINTIASGIIKFDGINSQIFDVNNSGLLSNSVTSMAQDIDGTYWFGTEEGIVSFDGSNWKTFFREYRKPYDSIAWSMCIDSVGTKYFATWSCIIVLKDNKISYIDTTTTKFYFGAFRSIVIDKKNNIWVGTYTSLAKYDGKDFKAVYGPAENVVVDSHNNKWFVTRDDYLVCDNLVVYNEDGLQGINGIEENFISKDETQMIYPNPASDFIEISVGAQLAVSDQSEIRIFNIYGQTVLFVGAIHELPLQIDVSGLAPGMYFVRIGDKVQKFIKL
jgi:ligand-binding sensor domain-containing protein